MEPDPDNHELDPLKRSRHRGWRVRVARDLSGGRVPRALIERILLRVGRAEKICGDVHLIVVDDRRMRKLNRQFRNKDRPTDVLSFPNDRSFPGSEDENLVGEIYCSLDHCRRWSSANGGTIGAELARLAVHGCLHLLGYDHGSVAGRKEMTRLENRYLAGAGLIAERHENASAHAD